MQKSWFVSSIVLCFSSGFLLPIKAQNLQATVTATVSSAGIWDYTLTNSEPAGSSNWLSDFYLPINAPVTNVQTANGWQVDTDYTNYIEWSNTEPEPFPDDIAPGLSISGFSFTTVATGSPVQYDLASWDHVADDAGPDAIGTTLAPYAPAAVPEASTAISLGVGLLPLLVFAAVRRQRKCGQAG